MNYRAYLQTSHWKEVRRSARKRAGGKCQLCSSRIRLEVHHNNYECLWHETPQDVVVLCRRCHAKFHGKPVDTVGFRFGRWLHRMAKPIRLSVKGW
jgi:5-methylcytosine-specific restriction endonuclease McrA